MGCDSWDSLGGLWATGWSLVMECWPWEIWGEGNIDSVCECLVKEMAGARTLGVVGNAYERHMGVLHSPRELAGAG